MDTPQTKLYPPPWIVDRVMHQGGKNSFGEPNFRVIWGGNRTYLVGGRFKKPLYFHTGIIGAPQQAIVTEVCEVREMLKYHPQRWHLERWRGPEWYGTQEEWWANTWDEDAQLHTMGPYPEKGDYEHVFYLAQCRHLKEDGDWCNACVVGCGEFIPLEPNFHMIERQIYALLASENVSDDEERAALFLREAKKRQVMRKIVGERVRGAMRPTMATQPTSWQDGTRCSVPEAKFDVTLPHSTGFRQSDKLLKLKEES